MKIQKLKNKVALITGGTSGIGPAPAQEFIQINAAEQAEREYLEEIREKLLLAI